MALFGPASFTEGRLVALLQDWEISAYADPHYIQILSPENWLRSQKVREVSAFLVNAIGSPPYWDRMFPALSSALQLSQIPRSLHCPVYQGVSGLRVGHRPRARPRR
jgi:hypothetical protein